MASEDMVQWIHPWIHMKLASEYPLIQVKNLIIEVSTQLSSLIPLTWIARFSILGKQEALATFTNSFDSLFLANLSATTTSLFVAGMH